VEESHKGGPLAVENAMLVLFSGENGARDTIRFIEEKAAVGIWFCDLKTRKMD
jgi:hypothetical protein